MLHEKVEQFIAFCEKMPDDKNYQYDDSSRCALGCFNRYDRTGWDEEFGKCDNIASVRPHTFSALAKRLRQHYHEGEEQTTPQYQNYMQHVYPVHQRTERRRDTDRQRYIDTVRQRIAMTPEDCVAYADQRNLLNALQYNDRYTTRPMDTVRREYLYASIDS